MWQKLDWTTAGEETRDAVCRYGHRDRAALRHECSGFFAAHGEQEFRRYEHEVLQELTKAENTVVATGGGVPCFFDNMSLMNAAGITIYFKLSPEKLAARLEYGKNKRPLLRGKSQEELVAFIRENLEQREPFYAQARLIVEGDRLSDEYMARHVMLYVENVKSLNKEQ